MTNDPAILQMCLEWAVANLALLAEWLRLAEDNADPGDLRKMSEGVERMVQKLGGIGCDREMHFWRPPR